MAFALGGDSDVAFATINDVFADAQTETCALYEVVEFDETLEDGILLFLWDTCTSVFAIEVDTAVLFAVAHLDVAFLRIFDGVGDEVGEDLLDAAFVEQSGEG